MATESADEVRPAFARLASSFTGGDGVVFVGSGLSATAGAPTWAELTTEFANALDPPLPPPDVADPLLVAQFYRNVHGLVGIVGCMRRHLTHPELKPSPCHDLVASLPVRVFVTTNYDRLLETALVSAGRAVHVIHDDTDLALWREHRETQVIKLHGDIDRPTSLIVSTEDYLRRLKNDSAIQHKIADLFSHRPILFIGYSMRDVDVSAVYQAVVRALGELKQPAFLLTFESDPHMRREWSRRGLEVIVLNPDVGESASKTLERVLSYVRQSIATEMSSSACDVLIVEDNTVNQLVTLGQLRRKMPKLEILIAKEGLEAILLIERVKPRLILLDLRMPVMDGWDFIRLLDRDASLCHIPIVVISAYAMPGTREQLLIWPNVKAVLTKPVTLDELWDTIRPILNGPLSESHSA